MQKYIYLTLLFLTSYFPFLNSQQTVPPVQQGGTGSITINPPVTAPSIGQQGPIMTSPVTTRSGPNAITIIVDYSGSMVGKPLEAAKRSASVLLDLIQLWGAIYPTEIGQLQVQFIQFGGQGESNVLFPLQSLTPAKCAQLKQQILTDQTYFSGTDYTSGIEMALQTLSNQSLNNKTIFLTDAGDGGKGPMANRSYSVLGDTKFIIYGKSGSVGDWLSAIPHATEQLVHSEYEVMAGFVATLFEFVDDINQYLVRRGTRQVAVQQPFIFDKHSPSVAHDLIISRPDPGLVIDEIVDVQGNPLHPSNYILYDKAATFYQIRLQAAVPKGKYKIHFTSPSSSPQLIHYISFESCNIQLNLTLSPSVPNGQCLIENENINFQFQFWDVDQQKAITYPDYLAHTAFRYEIHNQVATQLSADLNQLTFTKAFPSGSSGNYTVLSAWNYNLEKLQQDDPPLTLVKEFCVAEDGRLVHLTYDTTQTWEGRQVPLRATVHKVDSTFLKNVTSIFIQTGGTTIELQQTQPNRNNYEGVIEAVEPRLYQLAIDNRHPNYKLGLDSLTQSQFEGRKRWLTYQIPSKVYTTANKQLSWTDQLQQAWRGRHGNDLYEIVEETYQGDQDILVAYELPFTEAMKEAIPIKIKLNKLFPDEQVVLQFDPSNYTYPIQQVKTGGWWGVFQSVNDQEAAITASFQLKGSQTLSNVGITQILHLQKQEGDMYIEQALQPAPFIRVTGTIQIALVGITQQVALSDQLVVFEIRTSYWSRFWVQAERIGKWILLGLTVAFLLISTLLALLYYRTLYMRKLHKWQNDIKYSSPEDFLSFFPMKLRKYIQQFCQQEKNNSLLFPRGVEANKSIKEKRAFRYCLQQQDRHSFDKKVARYYSMKELQTLSAKVRQQHTDGVEWVFYYSSTSHETIRIRPFEQDQQPHKESVIRVRNNAETAFGDFLIRDHQLYFHNPYNIVYLQDKHTGEWEWIDSGSETLLESGQTIQFGPDLTTPYFKAIVYFDSHQLGVTFLNG